MIKKLFAALLCAAFIFSYSPYVQAAEGNMDGDGGGMESGTGESYWNPGNDGVRITVVDKTSKQAVGSSFDWTNVTPSSGTRSFTRRNKLQYLSGSNLTPNSSNYDKKIPSTPIPPVVSSSGASNIDAVKSYFTDRSTVEEIADHANLNYETLISGRFTILIEPIAYFRYDGTDYAMTATEAALYDRLVDGDLRQKMGFLTHQNLPLSMFLEADELGISAWGGGGGIVSDENILRYLGVGTVNFGEEDLPPPVVTTYDYEYRADTDVVTAVTISTGVEINPDNPGQATFHLPNGSISKEYVIPGGESQLVWVKWHTPNENTVLTIPVSVSGGSADDSSITVKITKLEEDTPPNPEGRDRNDGFSLKPHPGDAAISSKSWGEWWAEWHEYWVWHSNMVWESSGTYVNPDTGESISTGDWVDRGEWVDEGWWDFFWRSYSASLSVTAKIFPDESVPTAVSLGYDNWEMKSAYGINVTVEVHMNTSGGSDSTSEVQHIITVFPEFDYETYNRLLVPDGGHTGYNAAWGFKENEYSQFKSPVHFTPIWYPDNMKYPVTFTTLDAWTPAGMLYYVLTADNITINGNAYDDWHISAGFGNLIP